MKPMSIVVASVVVSVVIVTDTFEMVPYKASMTA